ncbi:MAG: single-stranded DNA-binding protein [Puniceicoccales bacterium]|jgi:single-strand DNA-binding protein|nr:single-stranded DNA-binding protein [Puniceicoccales bacterium]
MSSFNKVILLGNLTRDPEMRTTNSGTPICHFGIATTRVIRSGDGENREEVVFVDVDAFGKQAEVIGRYFTKGRPIFIEGRLRLDQWESSSGEKRSKLCIVLESFQFIGSARFDDDGGGDANFTNATPSTGKKAEPHQKPPLPNRETETNLDEDVPF